MTAEKERICEILHQRTDDERTLVALCHVSDDLDWSVFTPMFSIDSAHMQPPLRRYKEKERTRCQVLSKTFENGALKKQVKSIQALSCNGNMVFRCTMGTKLKLKIPFIRKKVENLGNK